MTLNIPAIEAAARAATPGPWTVKLDPFEKLRDGRPNVWGIYGPPETVDYGSGPEQHEPRIVDTDCGVYEPRYPDALHIATSDPTTVLALIARIREHEAGLLEALDCYDEKPGSSEWSGCLCPSSHHTADCLEARIATLRELVKP